MQHLTLIKFHKNALTTILLLFLSFQISTQTTHPWNAENPSQSNVQISEYTDQVKFANAAFLNNIGDFNTLSEQIQNFTKSTDS